VRFRSDATASCPYDTNLQWLISGWAPHLAANGQDDALTLDKITRGDPRCPCLTYAERARLSGWDNSTHLHGANGRTRAYVSTGPNPSVTYSYESYDSHYGLDFCKQHDKGLAPKCDPWSTADPNSPDASCNNVWCYVDPNNCDIPDLESASGFGASTSDSTKFSGVTMTVSR
jgi:hypothetical protein